MILYLAFTATLNLCVGYLMGVYFGRLPGLSMLPKRQSVDPPEAAIDLSSERLKPTKLEATPPKPVSPKVEKPAAEPNELAEPSAEKEPSAVKESSAEKQPSAAREAAAKKPSPEEVMNGLADFQAQLAKAGEAMKASADDEEEFGHCSERLQEANHAYLEEAQHTIEELAADPDDQAATACREVLEENTKRVSETSDEIDAILADGVSDKSAREKLITTTDSLSEAVGQACEKMEAGQAPDKTQEESPPDIPQDLESQLATIEALQEAIDGALQEDGPPVVVAALRRDPGEAPEGADPADLESRLLASIAELAGEALDATQILAQPAGDQVLMLLKGDTVEEASHRLERVRQQVEKTTFLSGEAKLHTTVTCALAEAVEQVTREELMEHVAEAIEESERHGVNRSYHHDGRFPAPVMPGEFDLRERTVKL